jgi:membrane protease YdiL (CAAX protease family)
MANTFAPEQRNIGKAVLVIIIALSVLVTILFWAAIKLFQLQGLPLYFSQLGLYLIFFFLAWWGMKQEGISLPVTKRLIVQALTWSLVGWVVFVLLIQLFGLAQLSEEFQSLQKIEAWKIGAQMLSTWVFVGLGEEVLFRGYFLKAFWRHFTSETDRRRMLKAVLLSSAFFSVWHLPVRIVQVLSGELDWVTLLISLLVLFLMGLGFSYLFIRSENIILTGLVHGLMDYPLVGKDTQLSFIILLAAIGCVEIARWTASKKVETSYRIPQPGDPVM